MSKRNVVYLGFSFCIMFTAWSTTQAMLSSVLGKNAFTSLSILYFTYAIACFIAPYIISKIGIKISFIISSLGYVMYIFSVQFVSPTVLWIISIYLGISAAILWVSQGSYITSLASASPESTGALTGLFWSINFISAVSGHAVAFIVMRFLEKKEYIIICFGFISLISFTMFFFLPELEKENPVQPVSLKGIWEMKNMKFIILFICYEGVSVTFQSGVFTHALKLELIPRVMFFYGLALLMGSYIWGKLYDSMGWRFLIGLNTAIHPTAYYLFSLQYEPLYYVVAFLLGCSDGICVNTINATIANRFQQNSALAFAIFKGFQSIATSIGFFLASRLTRPLFQIIIMSLMVIGSLLFYSEQQAETPLDKAHDKEEVEI